VCLPGTGQHSLRVGLLPASLEQLPLQAMLTGRRVTIAGVESFCQSLGPSQVWLPAAADGRRLLSATLPAVTAPAVLTLHLLPDADAAAAAADGAAQPGPVHPLASLPLLVLPEAAAEEVLQLFANMVGEVKSRSKDAALDEAAAARQAYWQHYVPFVQSWRSLLLAARTPITTSNGSSSSSSSTHRRLFMERQPKLLRHARALVPYMASHGMRACLVLAKQLLGEAAARMQAASAASKASSPQQGQRGQQGAQAPSWRSAAGAAEAAAAGHVSARASPEGTGAVQAAAADSIAMQHAEQQHNTSDGAQRPGVHLSSTAPGQSEGATQQQVSCAASPSSIVAGAVAMSASA
jgi:hypothetical protein